MTAPKPAELAQDRDPWLRQPGEPQDAWDAFARYRDGQPRRSEDCGPKVKVKRWRRAWQWERRCEALDVRRESQAFAAEEDELKQVAKRHIQLAQGLQALGGQQIGKIAAKATAAEGPIMSPRDVALLVGRGVEIERLARDIGRPAGDDPDLTAGGAGKTRTYVDDLRDMFARHADEARRKEG